jgi:hypothetical protein
MKRFRVSMRLLLLFVALLAVVFAWIGQLRQLRFDTANPASNTRTLLSLHNLNREVWLRELETASLERADKIRRVWLPETEVEIARLRKQLETSGR